MKRTAKKALALLLILFVVAILVSGCGKDNSAIVGNPYLSDVEKKIYVAGQENYADVYVVAISDDPQGNSEISVKRGDQVTTYLLPQNAKFYIIASGSASGVSKQEALSSVSEGTACVLSIDKSSSTILRIGFYR